MALCAGPTGILYGGGWLLGMCGSVQALCLCLPGQFLGVGGGVGCIQLAGGVLSRGQGVPHLPPSVASCRAAGSLRPPRIVRTWILYCTSAHMHTNAFMQSIVYVLTLNHIV